MIANILQQKTHIHLIIICLLFGGCGIYSFSGINIDYEKTKTISISQFYNDSGNGPPILSQTFTEKLRDYFQQNTSLVIVNDNGDLILEGSITGYRIANVGARAGSANNPDEAALTRLSINVKAIYTNVNDNAFDFDKSFTFFADYDPEETTLEEVEEELVEEILDQIVIDIFNESVANW